jgi:hypothetical protein
VDGTTNPLLANFTADQVPLGNITIYRDGRVDFGPTPVAGVTDRAASRPIGGLGTPVPSPARSATEFRVDPGSAGHAELRMFDVGGRRVRTLVPQAGRVRWDLADETGARVANGVYFAVLAVDGRAVANRRVVVVD